MKWKMNACDFFKKWYSENKNNIAGKQVNEVYYTYRAQAIKENSRPYSKKYFTISRFAQPPFSCTAAGKSQWNNVAAGSIPRASIALIILL